MKKIFLGVLVFLALTPQVFAVNPVPLPKDPTGMPIQAISKVINIMNISITTSSYVAVSVPVAVPCKSVYIKTRSGNSWRMATSSNPSSYALIDFNVSLALVAPATTVLFYVRADTSNDTLEVIFMD